MLIKNCAHDRQIFVMKSDRKFNFLGILIPKKWSPETGLLLAIAASLIARSISDIWMIQNATVIESTIITMNKPKFNKALFKYLCAMPAVRLT